MLSILFRSLSSLSPCFFLSLSSLACSPSHFLCVFPLSAVWCMPVVHDGPDLFFCAYVLLVCVLCSVALSCSLSLCRCVYMSIYGSCKEKWPSSPSPLFSPTARSSSLPIRSCTRTEAAAAEWAQGVRSLRRAIQPRVEKPRNSTCWTAPSNPTPVKKYSSAFQGNAYLWH